MNTETHNLDPTESRQHEIVLLCAHASKRWAKALAPRRIDGDDFCQDLILKALAPQRIVKFQSVPKSVWPVFVARMARFTYLDHIRALNRQDIREVTSLDIDDLTGLIDFNPLATVDAVALEFELRALRGALAGAICKLRSSSRQVFLLFYFKQLSIREISNKTGRSANAVKQCISSARRMIRNRLIDSGWDAFEVSATLAGVESRRQL